MACAISIVIALVGYICMNTLPIEQYPDIAPPTVRISTTYTGADANTIMKSVVQPLEEAINGVPDMTYITSSASSSGDVSIVVYFKAGTDPDLAAVNVQNRVTRATAMLPADYGCVYSCGLHARHIGFFLYAVRCDDCFGCRPVVCVGTDIVSCSMRHHAESVGERR